MNLPFLLAASLCLAAMHSQAESVPERWQSPGGEFTVLFSGKPQMGQVEADPTRGTAHLDVAFFRRPDGVERAEASANQRTRIITRGEAIQQGEAWAKFLNVANAKITFDDFSPTDKKLIVKGTTMSDGASMNMMAVFHWGKKTFLLVWVAESGNASPTPASARFFASVHQSWP